MRHIEDGIHKAVAQTLDLCLLPDTFWSSIGHGGFKLNRATAGRLKAMGVKAGVPDIMVAHDGVTLGVELKSVKGRLSDAQERRHAELRMAGHKVEVCRSIADVIDALDAHRIPHAIVSPATGAVLKGMIAHNKEPVPPTQRMVVEYEIPDCIIS